MKKKGHKTGGDAAGGDTAGTSGVNAEGRAGKGSPEANGARRAVSEQDITKTFVSEQDATKTTLSEQDATKAFVSEQDEEKTPVSKQDETKTFVSEQDEANEAGAGADAATQDNGAARPAGPADPDAGYAGPDMLAELAELFERLAAAENKNREYLDRLQRTAADFDNYKRRTQIEMERMYTSSAADVIAAFLPVADSIERAVGAVSANAGAANEAAAPRGGAGTEGGADKPDPYRDGLLLIERQVADVLNKLGVDELPGAGEQFDPNLHEAVMHFEDAELGVNVIAEVFRKGYKYKDRIVRHSVVKVAN